MWGNDSNTIFLYVWPTEYENSMESCDETIILLLYNVEPMMFCIMMLCFSDKRWACTASAWEVLADVRLSSDSDLLQSVFSNLCCWNLSWWGSRICLPRVTVRERGEAEARPETPADKTQILTWTTNWNTKAHVWTGWKTAEHFFKKTKETGWHIPGNEHLFLNVGQELGMIFAGQIQALSMETKDLQTVHHVEQNVWFLKLWHFLYTKRLCCNNRHCSFGPECEPALTQYLQNCVY